MRSLVWSGVGVVGVGGWCGWRWFRSSIRPRSGQGVGAERPGTRSTGRPAGGGQSQSRVRPGSRCFEAADLAVAKAVVTEGEDLARDGDLGRLAPAPVLDPLVEALQRPLGLDSSLRRLDQSPARVRR